MKSFALFSILAEIDLANTKELKAILDLYGWVNISKFGEQADSEAWLLVQHADHEPLFQAGVAFILEQLYPLGETQAKNFAYLYDRVAVNFQQLGLKQRYGTQATIEGKELRLHSFEGNLSDLNKRRKSLGLVPIEQYLEQLRTHYMGDLAQNK